jgi:hypothetical protein
MSRRLCSLIAVAGGCMVLVGAAGCGQKEAAVTTPQSTPQQSIATDNRIPPAKRAQIEQIMAQQQAAHAGPAAHP